MDNTIYTVPRIRLGKPPIHSFNACLCYIIYKLKKGGFRVDYIFPDKLFIRWNEGSDASVNLAAAKYFAPKIPAAAASSKSAVNDIDRTICRPASTHVAAPSSSFPGCLGQERCSEQLEVPFGKAQEALTFDQARCFRPALRNESSKNSVKTPEAT